MAKYNHNNRDTGIDLLRILAAIGVIIIHVGDNSLSQISFNSLNYSLMIIIESIAHCSVDVFILISGYYSIYSNGRNLGKPFILLIQTWIVQFLWYSLLVYTDRVDISLSSICKYCTPNNYFVILFITLYFISPFINRLLLSFSKRELKKFLIVVILIFSIYSIFVDLYGEFIGEKWFGLSPIGAWGSQQGFTIVNFILVYIIGACLRIFDLKNSLNRRGAALTLLACIVVDSIWAFLNSYLSKNGLRSAWCYHNPLILLMSVSLFTLFLSVGIKSKVINRMAPAAFMCYILHVKVLSLFPIEEIITSPLYIMLPALLLLALSLFVVSWGAYELFFLFFHRLIDRMNNFKITFFD